MSVLGRDVLSRSPQDHRCPCSALSNSRMLIQQVHLTSSACLRVPSWFWSNSDRTGGLAIASPGLRLCNGGIAVICLCAAARTKASSVVDMR